MGTAPELYVERRLTLPRSAETVWALIGDFGGLGLWMPGVTDVTLRGADVGAVRRCTTVQGVFEERLVETGPFRASYEIVSGPLPVRDYRATIEARSLCDTACEVRWCSTFRSGCGRSDDDARRAVSAVYGAGFGALSRIFGNGESSRAPTDQRGSAG